MQYLKFDIDAQRFFNRRHSAFAFRFQTGVGIPYGTSTTLPYIKQYFVGGAYSLRGFRIRTLGPGNTQNITASGSSAVIDRTGDIKLELNSEWRFDITKLFGGSMKLNGALFADVGNIWTANEYGTATGGKFEFSKFGGDLAADAGLGLRFDLGFFVIRFDYAMPIKRPIYSADGTGGWVIRDLNLLGPQIRRNDWVLNFAIGYPF
jgi:outer membrane protein assembly factor BamA